MRIDDGVDDRRYLFFRRVLLILVTPPESTQRDDLDCQFGVAHLLPDDCTQFVSVGKRQFVDCSNSWTAAM